MSKMDEYKANLKRNECGIAENAQRGQGLVLLLTEKWTVPSPHRVYGWEQWKTSAGVAGSSEARGRVLADLECARALRQGLGTLKRMQEDAGGPGVLRLMLWGSEMVRERPGMFGWALRGQECECEGWKNQ